MRSMSHQAEREMFDCFLALMRERESDTSRVDRQMVGWRAQKYERMNSANKGRIHSVVPTTAQAGSANVGAGAG